MPHVSAVSVNDSCALYRSQFVDNILNSMGFGFFQVIAFLLVGSTYFAVIFDALTLTFVNLEVSKLWNITSLTYATVPAVTCFTNLFGEMLFGSLSDHYGRVWPYALCVGITAVFVLASAFSPSFIVFVVLRGLASFGIGGILDLPYPTLIEFLPTTSRGSSGVLIGFVQAIGCCMTGGLAWWVIPRYANGWRYFIMITSIPTFAVAIFRLVFYVESPHYLVSHGKIDRAWQTLALMARFNCKDLNNIVDKNHFYVTLERTSDYSIAAKRQCIKNLTILIKQPFLRRTICLSLIYTTYNLAYYGSIYFLPVLAKNLNLPEYLITFGGFTAQIPGTAFMAIIINWPCFGHRNTLRFFTLGAAIFYFLFAFVQYQVPVAVFIIIVYFFMMPISFQLFTYLSESYPTNIRATALGFNTVVYAINGMWLPFVGGYMADLSVQYPWLSPAVWGSVLILEFIITLFLNHEIYSQDLKYSINS